MSNRRSLIRMDDEDITSFVHGRHTVQIASHASDGSIHLVPLWYGFLGDSVKNIAFVTFEKSQKVKNLLQDDTVTALIETGEEYGKLKGLQIVGHARIHRDVDTIYDVASQIITRYWGITAPEENKSASEKLAQKRVVIEIVPDKVRSWNHEKLHGAY